MWECESCHRHVLRVSPVCPFCTHRRISALGLAVATPVLLSACYGLPPCQSKDFRDADGDGYTTVVGYCNPHSTASQDCDDSDPSINPGAEEICDNKVDENCDGIYAGTG